MGDVVRAADPMWPRGAPDESGASFSTVISDDYFCRQIQWTLIRPCRGQSTAAFGERLAAS